MVAKPPKPAAAAEQSTDPLAHKRSATAHITEKPKPQERHNVASIAGLGLVNAQAWFEIPLELRQRYWRETDFGQQRPADDLIAALIAAAPNGFILDGRK